MNDYDYKYDATDMNDVANGNDYGKTQIDDVEDAYKDDGFDNNNENDYNVEFNGVIQFNA